MKYYKLIMNYPKNTEISIKYLDKIELLTKLINNAYTHIESIKPFIPDDYQEIEFIINHKKFSYNEIKGKYNYKNNYIDRIQVNDVVSVNGNKFYFSGYKKICINLGCFNKKENNYYFTKKKEKNYF